MQRLFFFNWGGVEGKKKHKKAKFALEKAMVSLGFFSSTNTSIFARARIRAKRVPDGPPPIIITC